MGQAEGNHVRRMVVPDCQGVLDVPAIHASSAST
jgi:hypothetical protein